MKSRFLIIIGMIGLSLLIPQVWGADSEKEFDMKDYDDTFTIIEKQVKYVTPYKITNATIDNVNLNCNSGSLALSISSNDAGILQLDMPQRMFGGVFMVLVDEKEWDDLSIIGNILTVNFPENTSRIEILGSYYISPGKYTGVCDVAHDPPYSYILSSLKQFKSGIPIDQIQCRDNLQLILKTSNNSPACVKEKTIPKLIERGWGEPAPIPEPELQPNTTSEANFDSEKYYEEFGFGSPLVYLDTSKPVLDNDNCDRYASWLTEHQKNDINRYDENERYPPWGNQIFPLVDYCIANGDLVKTVADDKIQWEFQLENEK